MSKGENQDEVLGDLVYQFLALNDWSINMSPSHDYKQFFVYVKDENNPITGSDEVYCLANAITHLKKKKERNAI